MCTLLVIVPEDRNGPVLLAANRDEDLRRPSTPPRRFDHPSGWLVTPRDLRAGGTWVGLNAAGVVVGITNRRHASHHPDRTSRGHLVTDALEATSAADAARRIADRDPRQTNGFHLLCADTTGAWRVIGDGMNVEIQALGPGIHLATERSFSGRRPARETSLEARLETAPASRWSLERLEPLLGIHAQDPLDGTCVHLESRGYGTRSSTLASIGDGTAPRLLHAEGPPCSSPYIDMSELMKGRAVGDVRDPL